MSLWTFPGTEDDYCEEMLVVGNVLSFELCLDYCLVTLGGPPACVYAKYDPTTQQCFASKACENILTKLVPTEDRRLEGEGEGEDIKIVEMLGNTLLTEVKNVPVSSEIVEVHCNFIRTVYETCLWADLEFGEDYEEGYQPKYMGWEKIRQKVLEALQVLTSGFQYDGSKANASHTHQEGGIGLPRCYADCINDPDCEYFAYSGRTMVCVNLGKLDYLEFKQNCGYVLRHAGMQGDSMAHDTEMRFAMKNMAEEVRAVLNNVSSCCAQQCSICV
jgi:hypothetical protein